MTVSEIIMLAMQRTSVSLKQYLTEKHQDNQAFKFIFLSVWGFSQQNSFVKRRIRGHVLQGKVVLRKHGIFPKEEPTHVQAQPVVYGGKEAHMF